MNRESKLERDALNLSYVKCLWTKVGGKPAIKFIRDDLILEFSGEPSVIEK